MIVRTTARLERVAKAVLKRIGDMGDMDIEVHRLTMVALLRWVGAFDTANRVWERQENKITMPAWALERGVQSGFIMHGDSAIKPGQFEGLHSGKA